MDRQNWIGRLKRIERIRKCIGAKRLTDPHDTDGTCLRGTVKCNYDELLTAFGEPILEGLDGKVDAEWDIQFPDGTISTIYNWKNGKNYRGPKGLPLWTIGEWNVGGNAGSSTRLVQDAITFVRTVK